MTTKIPFLNHGAAAFSSDEYGQVELLAGKGPSLHSEVPVGESTEIGIYAVVGVNGEGELALATYGGEGQRASGALTFSDVASADETVTIGSTVYTFKATPSAAYEVLVGGTAAACAANLLAAINAAPLTEGAEEYGEDTEAHPDVVASLGASATVIEIVAKAPGQAGEVATTETLTDGAFGAATLTGGSGEAIQPLGVLTAAVSTGVGEAAIVDIWRDGVFNLNALVWDASFNTKAKKKAAFEGAPTPTQIIIGENNDPAFT